MDRRGAAARLSAVSAHLAPASAAAQAEKAPGTVDDGGDAAAPGLLVTGSAPRRATATTAPAQPVRQPGTEPAPEEQSRRRLAAAMSEGPDESLYATLQ